jgi:hypothetical protein
MTGPHASATKRDPALVNLMLRTHRQFIRGLDLTLFAEMPSEELRREIHNTCGSACDTVCAREGITLSPNERDWLIEAVLDEAFGLGPLEPLLKDPATEAIVIQGPTAVLVEREGRVWDTAVVFRDDDHLQTVLEGNQWKDCVTEVSEAGVRSIRFDVRKLREAVARFDAERDARVKLAGERSQEHQGPDAQSWIMRLWNRLFVRR